MLCVSLFSGCGGLDIGVTNAGFDVVLANDNDSFCRESYLLNNPNTIFHLGSVSDLTENALFEYLGSDINTIDLLVGGPPCPPFSKSRFYRKEKPRGIDDPVGFETLSGYFDVLEILKPRAFLLENVPGMQYKVHNDAFDYIKGCASGLGYKCVSKVVNAANYGIPQIRERFFMVGLLDGCFEFPDETHHNFKKQTDLFGTTKNSWVTAGDVIYDLDTEENASDEGHFAGGKHHNLLHEIPPGDNYLYFTEKRGYPNPKFEWRSRYWSFLLKLSPDMPSWTIQARRSNNMGPFHWKNRILRIEEIKRLQTFPDNWILSGNIERQWRQIGNAVPPLLAEVIAQAIFDKLKTQL
jgi:DNA (cytosine-5)-methyltransferase 1